jgi:hypothetical protein
MNPGDIRKLLGGYAADTLTAEERKALFEAALTDQDLFNELAREQALKELLEEPAARRQLLAALEEKPAFLDRLRAWMGRPVAWVTVGSLAAVALLVVVAVRRTEAPLAPEPVLTAKLDAPSLPATPPPVPQAAADREKGAVAPSAVPAAPPAPAQKAKVEGQYEVAVVGQAARADASAPPLSEIAVLSSAEAQALLDGVPTGNDLSRSSFRGGEPGGVVGGIAGAAGGSVRAQAGRGGGGGGSATATKPVIAQSNAVVMDQVAVLSSNDAIGVSREEARQVLSLSAVAVADTAAGMQSKATIVLPPVPYKILRAGADGKFAEAPAGTAFRPADRVRVVFSPPGPGRLVATAANRPKPLLDRAVRQGATVNLDVPALVSSLQVAFTSQRERSGASAPAPVTFSIPIHREPAP